MILLRIGTPGHGRWDTPTPPEFYDGDQLVPVQCMISVRGWPDAVETNPTAQALVAEVAVTPRKLGPAGVGLNTWDQAVPFQCKISGEGPAGA